MLMIPKVAYINIVTWAPRNQTTTAPNLTSTPKSCTKKASLIHTCEILRPELQFVKSVQSALSSIRKCSTAKVYANRVLDMQENEFSQKGYLY